MISLSNRKKATAAKVERYIESGVPAVWVIYPKKKIVEVHGKSGVTFYTESDMLSLPAELPPLLSPSDKSSRSRKKSAGFSPR